MKMADTNSYAYRCKRSLNFAKSSRSKPVQAPGVKTQRSDSATIRAHHSAHLKANEPPPRQDGSPYFARIAVTPYVSLLRTLNDTRHIQPALPKLFGAQRHYLDGLRAALVRVRRGLRQIVNGLVQCCDWI